MNPPDPQQASTQITVLPPEVALVEPQEAEELVRRGLDPEDYVAISMDPVQVGHGLQPTPQGPLVVVQFTAAIPGSAFVDPPSTLAMGVGGSTERYMQDWFDKKLSPVRGQVRMIVKRSALSLKEVGDGQEEEAAEEE